MSMVRLDCVPSDARHLRQQVLQSTQTNQSRNWTVRLEGTSMNKVELDRSRPTVGLRIGKHVISEGSGGIFSHVDPTTGRPDREIPLAGPEEIDRAVEIAHQAHLRWRDTRP